MVVIGIKISRKCQKLPMLVVFCHFLTRYTPLKLFPQDFHKISHKISHSISRKIFPQEFPARISRKNFPQDFPARIFSKNFPARISHKIFPQDFPAIFSRKNFPQARFSPNPFQMLNFHQFPASLLLKGPRFPTTLSLNLMGTPNQE